MQVYSTTALETHFFKQIVSPSPAAIKYLYYLEFLFLFYLQAKDVIVSCIYKNVFAKTQIQWNYTVT